MQIPFAEGLPFVAVQPDSLAAVAMVNRERKIAAGQVLDHAKAALGTIERQARLSQSQVFAVMHAFGFVGRMVLDPVPVLCACNPVAATAGTLLRRKIWFQIVLDQFR